MAATAVQPTASTRGAPLTEQFPAILAAWLAHGYQEEHFRDYLLGVGAIEPTWEDVRRLLDEQDRTTARIRTVLAHLEA